MSKASDDLPDPDSPVITTNLSRGIVRLMSFKVVRACASNNYLVHELLKSGNENPPLSAILTQGVKSNCMWVLLSP